ncbi:MAG: hypothetical protein CFE28_04620 [Alphaproteobacteria bacterium PA2]|nr:MAG: hypothetical protein CFE28_04620 [Alphaproteobacteria bacterium PA2]
MLDRLFLPALIALTIGLVSLAMVWPQGLGDRSPGPFGHTPVQQTPEMKAAMAKESTEANERAARAKQALIDLQAQTLAPTQ